MKKKPPGSRVQWTRLLLKVEFSELDFQVQWQENNFPGSRVCYTWVSILDFQASHTTYSTYLSNVSTVKKILKRNSSLPNSSSNKFYTNPISTDINSLNTNKKHFSSNSALLPALSHAQHCSFYKSLIILQIKKLFFFFFNL